MHSLPGRVAVTLIVLCGLSFSSKPVSASRCCKCGSSITTDCPEGAAACSEGFFNTTQFLNEVCINVPCSTASCADAIECSEDAECAVVGACCLADGSCSVDTADVCAIRGGTYNGDGTRCQVGLCSPIGCCKCAGSISTTCPEASPACSEAYTNAVDYSDEVCLPSPCSISTCTFGADCASTFPECGPLGACCHSDGTCTQDTVSSCEVRGGVPAGNGVACGEKTCGVGVPAASNRGVMVLLIVLTIIAISALIRRAPTQGSSK